MMTALIAVPLALALGIAAALYRNSFFDRAVNSITLTTISFPEFFIAYMLAFIVISRDTFIGTQFAQSLPQWLAGGIDGFLHLIPKFPTLANVNDQTPFWRARLAQHAARPDAHHGHRRPHDADDARRDHQPARQPLYRDGAPQGPVAAAPSSCATPCPMPGRRSSP